MGWCTGSYFAESVYNLIREDIPEEKREGAAYKVYKMAADMDADCWEWEMNIIKDGKVAEKEGWLD